MSEFIGKEIFLMIFMGAMLISASSMLISVFLTMLKFTQDKKILKAQQEQTDLLKKQSESKEKENEIVLREVDRLIIHYTEVIRKPRREWASADQYQEHHQRAQAALFRYADQVKGETKSNSEVIDLLSRMEPKRQRNR